MEEGSFSLGMGLQLIDVTSIEHNNRTAMTVYGNQNMLSESRSISLKSRVKVARW